MRTSTANTDFKDPWSGSCNHLNAASWWASQKPYTEPAIVKAQVGLTDPLFPACPLTETPNEDSCIGLGAAAKFTIIFRNETSGTTASMRIIKPDGTNLSNWTHASNASYSGSYYGYTRTMPSVAGTYIFEAVYNNDTCRQSFKVDCSAVSTGIGTLTGAQAIQVYPNPTNDKINIEGTGLENGKATITLRNILGQTMLTEEISISNNTIQKSLSVSQLANGMYFLSLETNGSVMMRKVEKN